MEDKENEKDEISIETRTLEELLLDLRTQKNWAYVNIIEKLNEKGLVLDEKTVKKWEIGLIYPSTDEIYKISELYMFPAERIIAAKTNSYKKGMASIHMMAIKWISYISGFSIKASIIGVYIFIFLAFIFAVNFFIDCANRFHSVSWK